MLLLDRAGEIDEFFWSSGDVDTGLGHGFWMFDFGFANLRLPKK